MFGNGNTNTNIDKDLSSGNNGNSKKVVKILIILVVVVILFFVVFYFVTASKRNGSSSYETNYFLSLNGNEEVIVYKNSTYLDSGFSAYDSEGNEYNEEVSILGEVDTNIVGEYEIIYSFRGVEKIRKVNVVANTEHFTYLILSGDSKINLKVGEEYKEPGYSVLDSVDSNLNSSVKISGSVNTSKVGTYKLIYSVVNSLGVTVTAERTIIVKK